VTTKGRQRFEIKNVVKQKPVLVCDVQMLPEDAEEEKHPEVCIRNWEL
jgi:hypothetical protein